MISFNEIEVLTMFTELLPRAHGVSQESFAADLLRCRKSQGGGSIMGAAAAAPPGYPAMTTGMSALNIDLGKSKYTSPQCYGPTGGKASRTTGSRAGRIALFHYRGQLVYSCITFKSYC